MNKLKSNESDIVWIALSTIHSDIKLSPVLHSTHCQSRRQCSNRITNKLIKKKISHRQLGPLHGRSCRRSSPFWHFEPRRVKPN